MGKLIILFIFDYLDVLVDIKHADKEDCFLIAWGDQSRRMDHVAYSNDYQRINS